MHGKTVILSRTDGIGDVILSLPMAGILKKHFPDCTIYFLAKEYTKEIIDSCEHIDHFIGIESLQQKEENQAIKYLKSLNASCIIHVFPNKTIASLAKKANIPIRIGTRNRHFHWSTCNKRPNLSRKNSPYHEAQLNIFLLKSLGIKEDLNFSEIYPYYGFSQTKELPQKLNNLIDKEKINIIIHPKSKGSAREWGYSNYSELLHLLSKANYKVFITGSKEEGNIIRRNIIYKNNNIIDITGRLSLTELISFINKTDALFAASTGPLHIAAAIGKFALGIYSPMRPIHPGRWQPIGEKANFITKEISCSKCKKDTKCECIENIRPEDVFNKINQHFERYKKNRPK